MFTKPIVIVLGAGASNEFGLPLGASLRESISNSVNFQFSHGQFLRGDEELHRVLREREEDARNSDSKPMKKWLDAGRDLAATMPRFVSVDEALHYWSERKEVVELGKVAIALELLKAERHSSLFNKDDRARASFANLGSVWLTSFVEMAVSGLKREEIEKAFESVTFINFNYDRVIEHFLYWSLQLEFKVPAEVSAKAVSSLNMIRPYGSLGRLEWQDQQNGIPFGTEMHSVNIFELATKIRTYTEQSEGSDIKDRISDAFESAVLVLFLGFGFHQQNRLLLYPKTGHNRNQLKAVVATVLGLHPNNHRRLLQEMQSSMGLHPRATLLGTTSAALLSDLKPMIMMALD